MSSMDGMVSTFSAERNAIVQKEREREGSAICEFLDAIRILLNSRTFWWSRMNVVGESLWDHRHNDRE